MKFKMETRKIRWRCSFCCCMGRRTSTLIVGIIDIILGILCILATAALLAQNLTEQSAIGELDTNEKAQSLQELIAGFVLVLIACGIPSVITLIAGIVTIYATTTGNQCLSAYSVALNFLLILGLAGSDIFLYCLGLRMSLLFVYLSATALQFYFGLVVFDFYKARHKLIDRNNRSNQNETSLPRENRKLATKPIEDL